MIVENVANLLKNPNVIFKIKSSEKYLISTKYQILHKIRQVAEYLWAAVYMCYCKNSRTGEYRNLPANPGICRCGGWKSEISYKIFKPRAFADRADR